MRAMKPFVTETADPDREVAAAYGHAGHDRRPRDAVRCVGRRFGRRHRQAEEEVIAFADESECCVDVVELVSRDLDDFRKELAREQDGPGGVPAMQLVTHVQGPLNQRLQGQSSRQTDRICQDWADDLGNVTKVLVHLLAVGAVVEPAPAPPWSAARMPPGWPGPSS